MVIRESLPEILQNAEPAQTMRFGQQMRHEIAGVTQKRCASPNIVIRGSRCATRGKHETQVNLGRFPFGKERPHLKEKRTCVFSMNRRLAPIYQSHAGRCNGGGKVAKARPMSGLARAASSIRLKQSLSGLLPASISIALLK